MAKYIRIKGAQGLERLKGLLSQAYLNKVSGAAGEGAQYYSFLNVMRNLAADGAASIKLYDSNNDVHWSKNPDFEDSTSYGLKLTGHDTTTQSPVVDSPNQTSIALGPDLFGSGGKLVVKSAGNMPANGSTPGTEIKFTEISDVSAGKCQVGASGNGNVQLEVEFELVDAYPTANPSGTE
jgi:hypothetical protein